MLSMTAGATATADEQGTKNLRRCCDRPISYGTDFPWPAVVDITRQLRPVHVRFLEAVRVLSEI